MPFAKRCTVSHLESHPREYTYGTVLNIITGQGNEGIYLVIMRYSLRT